MKKSPLVLCIMDGFGIRTNKHGNAIAAANIDNIKRLMNTYPHILLEASGEPVGLPEGQMGNSEVGHLNIGAGRVVYQSLTLINKMLKENEFGNNKAFNNAIEHAKKNKSALHIMGLLSDGGVHSHITHILGLMEMAAKKGIKDLYIHCFFDGRDVDTQTGPSFVKQVQDKIQELGVGAIASLSGRYYAMDRDKNFARFDIAYQVIAAHNGKSFTDPIKYIYDDYSRQEKTGSLGSDEFIYPAYNSDVDGAVKDNDSIIYANFRPDRAIQIGTIFTNPHYYEVAPLKEDGTPAFTAYLPNPVLKNIFFVQLMKYADSVKGEIAYELPTLDNVLGIYLADKGYTQLRIAETEKYAHVTFFFDGTVNYDGLTKPKIKGCDRILINSPKVATYDLKPEMSAYEVIDRLEKEIDRDVYDVIIVNFANCDMVGHTAIFPAVVKAVETVDACVNRLYNKVNEHDGVLIITADHGNADEIIDDKEQPMTAHTTNPVPFIICSNNYKFIEKSGKLGDIAPTMLTMLGTEVPKEMDGTVLVKKL